MSVSSVPPGTPKTSLDYLIDNESLYQSSDQYKLKRNPYITSFVSNGIAHRMVEMGREDRAVHRLVNHKKLRKEVTESYGALVALERCARSLLQEHSGRNLSFNHQHQHTELLRDCSAEDIDNLLNFTALRYFSECTRGQAEATRPGLTVLDVCSGKGITSVLLALLLPCCSVTMIDFNGNINRDHLKSPACANVSFVHMDIYTDSFQQYLAGVRAEMGVTGGDVLPESPPALCAVLGTHLCGHLSTRLVNVFMSEACDGVAALVLSPCCMPRGTKNKHKKKEITTQTTTIIATNNNNYNNNISKKRLRSLGVDGNCEQPRQTTDAALSTEALLTTSVDTSIGPPTPYTEWCSSVQSLLPLPATSRSPLLLRDMKRDINLLSEKNVFISAVKNAAKV